MGLKETLKKIPGLLKVYRILTGCLEVGFHGDRVFQSLIKKLVLTLPISSFVETGTYLGDSTEYVAKRRKDLPIFSCEVNEDFFNRSQKRLRKFKNVKLHLSSSPEFLRELVKSSLLGNFPLFFLDAHWYNIWPLEDEVEIITTFFNKAIIIIDDFEVPSQPKFYFEKSRTDNRICGFELIKSKLNRNNMYKAIFPSYPQKEAFPILTLIRRPPSLTGHIVIFQNLEKEFELIRSSFPEKYFSFNLQL